MSEKQAGESAGRRARLRAAVALVVFALLALLLVLYPPEDLYLWIKALHIIAVISWMAGLLYLPRLFVYHFDTVPGSPQSDTFCLMERRLLKVIMNPAMVVSWVFGLYLASVSFGFSGGWLHAKLVCVVVLSGLHMYLARAVRLFGQGGRPGSIRHWRLVNEGPTLLMIAIVVLVVVKPF